METEITNTSAIEQEEKLLITSDGELYLKTAAKWANFLAILGFIGTGIMILIGVLMLLISPLGRVSPVIGFPMSLASVMYILIALLYFFPAFYLYNFANKAKLALTLHLQEELDNSLKNLKRTFKFLGIMTIVIISAYLILIPVLFISTFSHVMGV